MRPNISPSVCYASAQFLDIIQKNYVSVTELHKIELGHVETAKVLELLEPLGLVTKQNSVLTVTPIGQKFLHISDPCEQIKFLLIEYCDKIKLPWQNLIPKGRQHVLNFAPIQVVQLFHEANVAKGIDANIVKFWDRLSLVSRQHLQYSLVEIGRAGERLSLQYERIRTEREPTWLSLENNLLGYDLASVISKTNHESLFIETKCSEKSIGYASFFLSRNEWKVASEKPNFKFHLWCLNEEDFSLATLDVAELEVCIPKDRAAGKWVTIEIPFSHFEKSFEEIDKSSFVEIIKA